MPRAIEVQNIWKEYAVGKHRFPTLSDMVRNLIRRNKIRADRFWALKEIDLNINEGEVVGIIGRNGAGKSTLLKLLSRITYPTEGRIILRGQVASLIEVGTGFHPELTGRENIMLNGTILGMTRQQIRSRMDDIMAFADIGKFIDTPVKHYSSGMFVRLGFAVAAHLEPDILVVDEVLSVGDMSFQQRCLGRMKDVAQSGRTVLFVSHNMGAVSSLCSRVVLLNEGQIVKDGNVEEVVDEYVRLNSTVQSPQDWQKAPDNSDQKVRLLDAHVEVDGETLSHVPINRSFQIQIAFETREPALSVFTNYQVIHANGTPLLSVINWPSASVAPDPMAGKPLQPGRYMVTASFPANYFNEGSFIVNVILLDEHAKRVLSIDRALQFTIVDTGDMRKEYSGTWMGMVRPRLPWSTIKIN